MSNKILSFVFISVLVIFVDEIYSAKRIVVGVAEFENLTGDSYFDRYCTGIADSLTDDLTHIRSIRVVERRQIAKILDKIPKFKDKFLDNHEAAELGNMVGASVMVVGSFQATEKEVLINARFVDVKTGQAIAGEKVRGKREKIFDLYAQMVLKLADNLGIEVTPSEREKIEKPETRYIEAYEKVALAKRIDYYEEDRRKAWEESRELAKKALEIDPEYEKAKILYETLWGRDPTGVGKSAFGVTVQSLQVSPTAVNSRGELTAIEKLLLSDFMPLFKFSYGNYPPAAILGGAFNVLAGGNGIDTTLFAFELEFNTRLILFKNIFTVLGVGLGYGCVDKRQSYYSPYEQTWRIGDKIYYIPRSGIAKTFWAGFLGEVFISTVLFAIPEKGGLTLDFGYFFGPSLDRWRLEMDFNNDGKIEEAEKVPLRQEWLQYKSFRVGGPFLGVSIRLYLDWNGERKEERSTVQDMQDSSSSGTKIIKIPSNRLWTNTGIVLQAGQKITIRIEGMINHGCDDCDVTPDGGWRMVGRYRAGAVLGKIGEYSPFLVGKKFSGRVTKEGTLFLGVNDSRYDDNRGSFTAYISVE